ncbi:uncharacterized protein LOC112899115 [Panicum hallii]|uniref:uncharacterized protein LOC112899115 n=1 Tax=Panicum hallii TaxID=206008 RepID=UPI000DF4CF0B|nr:uncharacterized protein LOC112899115 [Panicum hallii]
MGMEKKSVSLLLNPRATAAPASNTTPRLSWRPTRPPSRGGDSRGVRPSAGRRSALLSPSPHPLPAASPPPAPPSSLGLALDWSVGAVAPPSSLGLAPGWSGAAAPKPADLIWSGGGGRSQEVKTTMRFFRSTRMNFLLRFRNMRILLLWYSGQSFKANEDRGKKYQPCGKAGLWLGTESFSDAKTCPFHCSYTLPILDVVQYFFV